MPLRIFGYEPKRISIDRIGSHDGFNHLFGGDHKEYGIRFANAEPPLHVVYWLDVTDPLVPIAIDGVTQLPLLFPFAYATSCGYSFDTNNIVTFYPHHDEPRPPWNAPPCFPAMATSFSSQPYDPTKPSDAIAYKGIFGWQELDDASREIAVRIAVNTYGIAPDEGPDTDWTLEDIVRCMYDPPFRQLARPMLFCDNPNCTSKADMNIIAIQQDSSDIEEIWGGMRGQTIWAMCPGCKSIGVAQQ